MMLFFNNEGIYNVSYWLLSREIERKIKLAKNLQYQ